MAYKLQENEIRMLIDLILKDALQCDYLHIENDKIEIKLKGNYPISDWEKVGDSALTFGEIIKKIQS